MATLAEIRAQYPQYSDMPDAALADALYKKFYSDMPRADFEVKLGLKTAPPAQPSGGIPGPRQEAGPLAQFGRAAASLADVALGDIPATAVRQVGYAVARPFTSPERATQISQAAAEPFTSPVGRLFGVEQTPEYQQEASRRLMNLAGRGVSSVAEAIAAKTGAPVADVENMLGTAMVAAPEGIRAARQANVLSPVQPALNALAKAKEKAGEATAGAAANITGAISGKPGAAFKEAFKAGKAGDTTFLDNLRGKATPDELLTTVQQGIDKIRADTSASYQTAKTGWAADKTALDFAPIDAAYQKVKNSLTVGGKSKIGAAEQKIVDEIGTVLDEWRNDPTARTALDLDALKQRIDAIYPESPKQKQAQRAITEVRNAVKDTIVKQASDYTQAMKDYDVQMTLLRDIEKGLSTGDKASKEAAINKLMGSLKSKPSSDFRRQLIDAIQQQGGVDIMPAIAGQELGQWVPSSGVGRAVMGGGLTTAAALRHPELALTVPLASPRLMGEAYYKMGQAAGGGKRAINALSKLTPKEAAYVNALMVQGQQNQNALAK